jgi:hypothetical protein
MANPNRMKTEYRGEGDPLKSCPEMNCRVLMSRLSDSARETCGTLEAALVRKQ